MMRRNFLRWIRTGVIAAATMLAAMPAQAQFFCDRHDDLVARLAETFREQRVASGLAGNAWIVELFVSPNGTWTVLMTDVQDRSCIVAAGDGWEADVVALGEGA